MNNSNKPLVGTDSKSTNLKLNNGFNVGDFMMKAELDYVYSKREEGFFLLNLNVLGEMQEDEVVALIENGSSVAVIEDMNMEVYNVEESKVLSAMIGI